MQTPEDVAGLLADLRARDYEVIKDEIYEARGSRVIELKRRVVPRRINVVCDRGSWEVGVKVGSVSHDLQTVKLALENAPYQSRAESHAERRASAVSVVDELSGHPLRWLKVQRGVRRLTRAYNDQFVQK